MQKLREVEEKDRVRNFQPPITGEDVMRAFGVPPCKLIGDIKTVIKDAILDGQIENDRTQAWQLMLDTGRALGREPVPGSESPM
jgi:poly(A) polymerase